MKHAFIMHAAEQHMAGSLALRRRRKLGFIAQGAHCWAGVPREARFGRSRWSRWDAAFRSRGLPASPAGGLVVGDPIIGRFG